MLTLLCGMIFLNKLEQYLFTDFFYYFCIGIIWYQYGMILILKHASQKIRAELKPLSLSLSCFNSVQLKRKAIYNTRYFILINTQALIHIPL